PQVINLTNRGIDIGSIGIGHGLHHHRCIATHGYMANQHLMAMATFDFSCVFHHYSSFNLATRSCVTETRSIALLLKTSVVLGALPITTCNGGSPCTLSSIPAIMILSKTFLLLRSVILTQLRSVARSLTTA